MHRRNLLQLLGAASALPVTNATAIAGNLDQTGTECALPECVHPVLGYIGFQLEEADELPEDLRPAHEVELNTDLPEMRGGEAGTGDGSDDREGAQEHGNEVGGNGMPSIPEFYFEPTGLSIEPGDVVQFTLASPDHTVTAYHPDLGRQRRVPEGVPPFSSPVLGGEAFWLYRFDEPGVYDVLCSPHEIFGMVMRIVVGEPEEDFGEPAPPDRRGPVLTAELVLNDEALAPANIDAEGEVSWADLADESKRPLLGPEDPPENGERDESEDGEDENGESEQTTYVDEVNEQVTLAYGETAELSNGVTFTIHGIEIHESLGEEEPENRDAFVVVEATAENTSDKERMLPDATLGIEILFEDVQDESVFSYGALDEGGYEPLEGGNVQPGVRREGVMLFEVDDGYGEDEIDILWQDPFFVPDDGEVDVRWTAS